MDTIERQIFSSIVLLRSIANVFELAFPPSGARFTQNAVRSFVFCSFEFSLSFLVRADFFLVFVFVLQFFNPPFVYLMDIFGYVYLCTQMQ